MINIMIKVALGDGSNIIGDNKFWTNFFRMIGVCYIDVQEDLSDLSEIASIFPKTYVLILSKD